MLRRNVAGHAGSSDTDEDASPETRNLIRQSDRDRAAARRRSSMDPSQRVWLLIGLAAIITFLTYEFPAEMQELEHEAALEASHLAQKAYEAQQEVEREVMDWWQQQRQPPIPEEEHPHLIGQENEATKRMKQQSSKWVDGEKRLKQKLKVLADRQAQGKDIGVPVLTRYLGEDFPAWPGEGVDKDEWNKKVADKYTEMRKEENEWIKMVEKFLDAKKATG